MVHNYRNYYQSIYIIIIKKKHGKCEKIFKYFSSIQEISSLKYVLTFYIPATINFQFLLVFCARRSTLFLDIYEDDTRSK